MADPHVTLALQDKVQQDFAIVLQTHAAFEVEGGNAPAKCEARATRRTMRRTMR